MKNPQQAEPNNIRLIEISLIDIGEVKSCSQSRIPVKIIQCCRGQGPIEIAIAKAQSYGATKLDTIPEFQIIFWKCLCFHIQRESTAEYK